MPLSLSYLPRYLYLDRWCEVGSGRVGRGKGLVWDWTDVPRGAVCLFVRLCFSEEISIAGAGAGQLQALFIYLLIYLSILLIVYLIYLVYLTEKIKKKRKTNQRSQITSSSSSSSKNPSPLRFYLMILTS